MAQLSSVNYAVDNLQQCWEHVRSYKNKDARFKHYASLIFNSAERLDYEDVREEVRNFYTIIVGCDYANYIYNIYLCAVAGHNKHLKEVLDALPRTADRMCEMDLLPDVSEKGLKELKDFIKNHPEETLPSPWKKDCYFHAACLKDAELLQLLVNYYSRTGELEKVMNSACFAYFQPVQLACQTNNANSLRILHENGASFEELNDYRQEHEKFANFALIETILYGSADALEYILKNRLYTDFVYIETGDSVLDLACQQSTVRVVSLLIQQEPSILNAPNTKGLTPLQVAVQFRNMPVARYLYDLKDTDKSKLTAQEKDLIKDYANSCNCDSSDRAPINRNKKQKTEV